MKIIKTSEELKDICNEVRLKRRLIGFVPTMGALHRGHLSLVEEAKKRIDFVVVSIFVNPTQFSPGEDFERYPRRVDEDAQKLKDFNTDLIFCPDLKQMYPDGCNTKVCVKDLSQNLCGAFRPGHFDGVTTIVAKFFNIVGPCTSFFGQKDYQQLLVIKKMVKDLNMPVEIIGMPTIRENDGLAMSSRNAYLSDSERQRACAIPKALFKAQEMLEKGSSWDQIHEYVHHKLEKASDGIDYVSMVDAADLTPISPECKNPVLLAIAVKIGKTRLIDNAVLKKI